MSVTTYTVVMRNTTISDDGSVRYNHEAVDHVPADQLQDYLTDARTRWAEVTATPEGN